MKFVIYFICLTFAINFINFVTSLSVTNKSSTGSAASAKTDAVSANKVTTNIKSQTELTFSSSNNNSVPEAAKMMESIISSRPIKVQNIITTEGEDKFNSEQIGNSISFWTNKGNLRFKQNENNSHAEGYELKNLEIPEIVRPKKNPDGFKFPQGWNYNPNLKLDFVQKFYQPQNLQNIEHNLLMEFQDFIDRKIHNDGSPHRLEVYSFRNVTISKK